MVVWKKARKKPVIIEFRAVKGSKEFVETWNGVVTANANSDYIVKGVSGELYPIDKLIFHKTHEILEE